MEEKSQGAPAGASATPPPSPEAFCKALDAWAELLAAKDEGFGKAWRTARMAIRKSCLLDRVLYGGERHSSTMCPVHKGGWSGIHLGWPGQTWADGKPVDESPMLRAWFDAGCRCFKHSCGCTTGWQPDAACGCVLDASAASASKTHPEAVDSKALEARAAAQGEEK